LLIPPAFTGKYVPRRFSQGGSDEVRFMWADRGHVGAEPRLDLDSVYTWQGLVGAYREFHAAAISGPADAGAPLYIYTPRDCGWGNRLIDLASAYQELAWLPYRFCAHHLAAPQLWLCL